MQSCRVIATGEDIVPGHHSIFSPLLNALFVLNGIKPHATEPQKTAKNKLVDTENDVQFSELNSKIFKRGVSRNEWT